MRLILAAAMIAATLAGCATNGSQFGDCTGSVSAGPGGGEVSGSCGDCSGTAGGGAGASEASVSGSCGECSGTASAGAQAEASGSCAGCNGTAEAGAKATSSGNCTGIGGKVRTKGVSDYSFAGTITAASPANPLGPGPATAGTAAAKSDTFEVANGTLDLAFSERYTGGSGNGRIEVLAPDGGIVFLGAYNVCGGAPGQPPACAFMATGVAEQEFEPGMYVVNYYIAGALDVRMDVLATVPA